MQSNEQVAQLLQRDRAKLDTFTINAKLYFGATLSGHQAQYKHFIWKFQRKGIL